jgi:hypothetical protein
MNIFENFNKAKQKFEKILQDKQSKQKFQTNLYMLLVSLMLRMVRLSMIYIGRAVCFPRAGSSFTESQHPPQLRGKLYE